VRRIVVLTVFASVLGGCQSYQTVLSRDGAEASNFLWLFGVFMAVCTLMYLLVVAGLLIAMRKRHRAEELVVETGRHEETKPVLRPILIGWTALMAVGLIALTSVSFLADRSNAAAAHDPQMVVRVTGNQWWWNVEYLDEQGKRVIRTANELHLPVDVPVRLALNSNDVIHSFWVPNFAGKQDLIPGRKTDLIVLARKTGLFRGQCAEFCGTQHTHMALDVTVESKADFARWAAAQKRVAFAPQTPLELAGYNYVTTRECSVCHNIAGTKANANVAPDLTHVASRRSIAAGTLPMSRGNLYGWIADPQSQKPGSHMPTIGLEASELHAVVAYLERLK
jgi:cytochrome c oxidase subunit II